MPVLLYPWEGCEVVCLSVSLHISEITRPNYTKFFMHVACGHGSVLWWHCDTLYTSGFVMARVACHVFLSSKIVSAETIASIPTQLQSTWWIAYLVTKYAICGCLVLQTAAVPLSAYADASVEYVGIRDSVNEDSHDCAQHAASHLIDNSRVNRCWNAW